MECNKDEAIRAKGIAESKLKERDFSGAKKFALKAQGLFPELEGLSKILDVVNVYAAVDYYGVLGVEPSADEDLIRKQYKRMLLSVHPDKSRIDGAGEACVILREAWEVLSDKDQRRTYDTKLNQIRAPNQASSFCSMTHVTYPSPVFTRPFTPGSGPSQPFSSFHHPGNMPYGTFFQHHQWTPPAETAAQSLPASRPIFRYVRSRNQASLETFWTGCGRCGIKYEYEKVLQDRLLQCPTCLNPFLAVAVPAPLSRRQQQDPVVASGGPTNMPPSVARTPQRGPENVGTSGGPTNFPPSVARTSQAGRGQPSVYHAESGPENVGTSDGPTNFPPSVARTPQAARGRPSVYHAESGPKNVGTSGGPTNLPPSGSRTPQAARGQPSVDHAESGPENVGTSGGPTNLPPVARTPQAARGQPSVYHAESGPENMGTAPCTVPGGLHRKKPVKRRRKDGQTCVGAKENRGAAGHSRVKRASEAELQPRSAEELSEHQIRVMLMGRAKLDTLNLLNKWKSAKSDTPHSKRVDRRDSLDAFDQIGSGVHPRHFENVVPEVDAPDEYESMVVPDANFHNFDNGRIEESFTEGQIWAAYDDDDGMPRYYALVQHVLSRCPFKMQIGWLNSKSTSEFGPLDWTASGFTKTIGNFRTGKSVIGKRLNSFSHPVKSVKRARGVIQIFPTKGDVWALYRNWSRNWNETTIDEIIHKYDLVVVLEDYTEDRGVPVAPLVKVPGFTSVFRQRVDQREIQTISREEMFRFSHQVPFYILSGLEAENAPKNCYELDPAALPLELLNVITDLDSVPQVHKTSSEDTKPLLKYSRRNKEKKIGENLFQS